MIFDDGTIAAVCSRRLVMCEYFISEFKDIADLSQSLLAALSGIKKVVSKS